MLKYVRNSNGFTLAELLVAMGVTMGLMVAVYAAVNSAQRNTSGIEKKVTAQQDVKPVLNLMAMEISMASYNPTFAGNLWVNPTGTCTAASTNQNYHGIQVATANSIAIEMDISGSPGGDGDGVLNSQNEVIRYNYDIDNLMITRETNCGGGQPFLGDTVASGNPRTVRVINDGLGLPVFRYYDGTGTEIAATSLPGAIPTICRIEIILAVETEDVDPNTGQRRRLIYSTSVIPRNHVLAQ